DRRAGAKAAALQCSELGALAELGQVGAGKALGAFDQVGEEALRDLTCSLARTGGEGWGKGASASQSRIPQVHLQNGLPVGGSGKAQRNVQPEAAGAEHRGIDRIDPI